MPRQQWPFGVQTDGVSLILNVLKFLTFCSDNVKDQKVSSHTKSSIKSRIPRAVRRGRGKKKGGISEFMAAWLQCLPLKCSKNYDGDLMKFQSYLLSPQI